jgi:glycosyltransferase involved in cell wall biosynthesis
MHKNIGFISTRLAGTDGVSLEANKWADVFEAFGHTCFWFAGELDRNPDKSFRVPEAHFEHSQNKWINNQIYGRNGRDASVTDLIHTLRSSLKYQLQNFIELFNIDLLVIENALSIPMNLAFGISLAEFISETQIPTIAHHHDFYWERVRYSVNGVGEYLRMAFPPNLPNIEHVVINTTARDELARRRGITATLIPNVLDFDNPPLCNPRRTGDFKSSFGLRDTDRAILQPTRIIPRKGIEHAVELVKGLQDPQYKLIISHVGGDEGFEYVEWVKEYAHENGVDLRFAKNRIPAPDNHRTNRFGRYCLWNIYPHADIITFPSLCEGFGNAFLEAIYFKKPLLINRYPTFIKDIEPKGFDVVAIDGFLTKDAVQNVRDILESAATREKMVNHNYQIAQQYYSYSILRERLGSLLLKIFRDSELSFRSDGGYRSGQVDKLEEEFKVSRVAV